MLRGVMLSVGEGGRRAGANEAGGTSLDYTGAGSESEKKLPFLLVV